MIKVLKESREFLLGGKYELSALMHGGSIIFRVPTEYNPKQAFYQAEGSDWLGWKVTRPYPKRVRGVDISIRDPEKVAKFLDDLETGKATL